MVYCGLTSYNTFFQVESGDSSRISSELLRSIIAQHILKKLELEIFQYISDCYWAKKHTTQKTAASNFLKKWCKA